MPGQAGRVPARDPARSVLDHMVGCCGGRSEAVESRDGGEKARGLEEQAGVRTAGSGIGGSRRAVTPVKGWSGGFAAAHKDLLVWAEPQGVRQCWGMQVSCLGTRVHVSPLF